VKVDGKYYREVMLKKQMLPVIRRISGNTFVFRQDSSPAYRARETVQLPELIVSCLRFGHILRHCARYKSTYYYIIMMPCPWITCANLPQIGSFVFKISCSQVW